jgi:hypothetical protein
MLAPFFIMLKWFKIASFLRATRKKHNRYDFKIVTSNSVVVIYMEGTDDELRLSW